MLRPPPLPQPRPLRSVRPLPLSLLCAGYSELPLDILQRMNGLGNQTTAQPWHSVLLVDVLGDETLTQRLRRVRQVDVDTEHVGAREQRVASRRDAGILMVATANHVVAELAP